MRPPTVTSRLGSTSSTPGAVDIASARYATESSGELNHGPQRIGAVSSEMKLLFAAQYTIPSAPCGPNSDLEIRNVLYGSQPGSSTAKKERHPIRRMCVPADRVVGGVRIHLRAPRGCQRAWLFSRHM